MNEEAITAICDMVLDLTKMKLRTCEHLAIDNFSAQLFARFLMIYLELVEDRRFTQQEWDRVKEGLI